MSSRDRYTARAILRLEIKPDAPPQTFGNTLQRVVLVPICLHELTWRPGLIVLIFPSFIERSASTSRASLAVHNNDLAILAPFGCIATFTHTRNIMNRALYCG